MHRFELLFSLSLLLFMSANGYAEEKVETAVCVNQPEAIAGAMPSDVLKWRFAVTSVRPHNPSLDGRGAEWRGAKRFTASMTVSDLIQDVYTVEARQLVNLPKWASQDLYDMDGVPDSTQPLSGAARCAMEYNLLVDRFGFRAHSEQRQMRALTLKARSEATQHLKLSRSSDPGATIVYRMGEDGGFVVPARNTSMSDFSKWLQQVTSVPVTDDTGLQGRYDFDLHFTPDESLFGGAVKLPPSPTAPPSLMTALKEQLGLELQSSKRSVLAVVVDNLSRPSPN